jgi:transcriptional regulator with XRE-family HTH domain
MTSKPRKRNPKGVRARPGLSEKRREKRLSQEKLAEITKLSTDTIQKIEAEEPEPVLPQMLSLYGSALGLEWEDLIPERPTVRKAAPDREHELGPWIILSAGPWTTAANGLQWRLHELRHKYVAGRRARGKLYDLTEHLAWQTLDDVEHWLTRHAEVCDRIGRLSPHVGRNIDSLPDRVRPKHWWVVDEWIEGPSFEQAVERGECDGDKSLRAMLDVAEVLDVLHREGLVYRALAPRSIYLSPAGAVVTDFELTRILEGGRTVGPQKEWPQRDAFLAPEVRGREKAHPSADLFSWAMVLAYGVSGKVPGGPVPAREIISGAGLPADIAGFAMSCLLDRKNRPESFGNFPALRGRRRGSSRGPKP